MRRLKFVIMYCFLIVFVLSCGTTKDTGSGGNAASGQIWEYSRIQVFGEDCKISDFPLAAYNPPPDRSFYSMFTGRVADDSFQQSELNIFDGRLIVRIDTDYILYNENRDSTYYVMVFDFQKRVSDGMLVKSGDIIGRVENGNAKVMVFSETLDPYLVINSNSIPVYYAGYYWFSPTFLSPTGSTKWITFDPVDNINSELIEIASHVTEERSGFTVYDKRVRFKTMLSQYPRDITNEERRAISAYEMITYGRNGIISHVTEINTGEYNYLLCWQNGFNEYLRKEYTLNNDIWLYGVIITYDIQGKKGYVFLRDFTQVSLEEMYEGRLRDLRGS